MSDTQAQQPANEIFYSSKDSLMGQSRKWLWITPILSIGVAASMNRSNWEIVALSAGLLLLVFGLAYLTMHKHLRLNQPLITLSPTDIASPNFQTKRKSYLWSEIAYVSVEIVGNVQAMQLQLAPSAGEPDKKSFLTGINPARPYVVLSPFSAQDQERLLNAVSQRVRGGVPSPVKQLTVEREFQEKLVALAPTPWVTYAIVCLNVVVWLGTLLTGSGVLGSTAETLLAWGGNAASEVQRGEWWRLLTATFLHSGVIHLGMNMIGLVAAGITVERIYGHRLFVLVYLGSALMGSAMSLHFSAQKAVSVGASGAVFGVAGALLMAVIQHRRKLPKMFSKQTLSGIGFFVVYSLMQGFGQTSIDNAAHIGGLLGGCLLAFILPKRFDMERFSRKVRSRSIAAAAAVFFATAGLATIAPPAAVDQRQVFASAAALDRGAKGYTAATQALQKEHDAVKAGKMTELELDERSRTVHAPAFRKVATDFSGAHLPASDPRSEQVADLQRLSELFAEALGMDSIVNQGTGKPEPVDPVRMAALEGEMLKLNERLGKLAKQARAQQNPRP